MIRLEQSVLQLELRCIEGPQTKMQFASEAVRERKHLTRRSIGHMTKSTTFRAVMATLTLLAVAAATPAGAVSIKHTNRAGGDPDQASIPVGHSAPPADTTGTSTFDKAHEVGNR